MKNRLAIACGIVFVLVPGARPVHARLVTASVAPTANVLRSQSQGDSASVANVVARFHAALTAGDSTAAMELLAPDAVILESGEVETRAEYRSHHLAADISYAKSMKTTRGPIHVSVRGDVAWASSTSTNTGESRGRQVSSASAELMVLVRTEAGWRIVAIHWSSRAQRPPA